MSVVGRVGLPYGTEVPIEPGAQVRVTNVVAEDDLAAALGTGTVAVLSTSRLIAWCERATLECVADSLAPGESSVAMRVHLDHFRPVPVARPVVSLATLERIEGRRFIFLVTALDSNNELIASGRIVRVVVDTENFLAAAQAQSD